MDTQIKKAVALLLLILSAPFYSNLLSPFLFALSWVFFWRGSSEDSRLKISMQWAALIALAHTVWNIWIYDPSYLGEATYLLTSLLNLLIGLSFGIWLYISHPYLKSPVGRMFSALLWGAVEASRLYWFTGFPWNMVGHSYLGNVYTGQILSVIGLYGSSIWLVFCTLAISTYPFKSSFSRYLNFLVGAYLLPLGLTFIPVIESKQTIDLAILHTNWPPHGLEGDLVISQKERWSKIANAVEKVGPKDLIIAPEGAIALGLVSPIYPLKGGDTWNNQDFAYQVIDSAGSPLIIGMEDDRHKEFYYNSAFCFLPSSEEVQSYAKRILVPGGEYIPFENAPILGPKLRKFVSQYGILDSLDAGEVPGFFQVPVSGVSTQVGVSICWEETYPHLVRELALGGAKFWVSLSNDCWFPQGNLAERHLFHARASSIMSGLSLIRATNQGVSAILNCRGEVLASFQSTNEHKEANPIHILEGKCTLSSKETLYRKLGEWPIPAFFLIFTALSFFKGKFKGE